jgi:hypothetical protein
MTIYDGLGILGSLLIVVAYFYLQTGKMAAHGKPYLLLNASGAGLILISLIFAFNLAAFVIEVFWLVISVIGLIRHWRK